VSLNENALLLSYGNIIDVSINNKIIALHQILAAQPFPGMIETVPAYASLVIFYDVVLIRKLPSGFTTAFDFVKNYVLQLSNEINERVNSNYKNTIAIPVYYNGEDLEYVSGLHQISIERVVQIHTAITYQVFMNGFLPGFAYMGTVDERIVTPRKEQPRVTVPAGSVGIAGAQTGIYPLDSPGGWQLLGKTPLKIFDINKKNPCLIKAGDLVQFVSINKTEFEKLNEY